MTRRFALPDLPLPARLVVAAFLISVGVGYLSALFQLHVQHASPGNKMPSPDDVIAVFHGPTGVPSQADLDAPPSSALRRLIAAPETGLPFNGTGSMSAAFFGKSSGWQKTIAQRPELDVRPEREGERKALLAWIDGGAKKKEYEDDAAAVPPTWGDQPITADYREGDKLKVATIIEARCLKCHEEGGEGNAALNTYEGLSKYLKPEKAVAGTGGRQQISVEKLTQSTHVHLLGFSMLYGMTGLVFAFTTYPAWLRCLLGPLVLFAQLADIGCWWLARLEGPLGERFALTIIGTGGIVGVGLFLQIVLSLGNLAFGRRAG